MEEVLIRPEWIGATDGEFVWVVLAGMAVLGVLAWAMFQVRR
jgi:hypothetical protein